MYQPYCKPNQIICGSGQVVIVTGWTVSKVITKYLQPHEYAAVGNLYSSTRGISPLVRNLLANPHVGFIVILGATKEDENSGSSQCLLDFFRNGFYLSKSDTARECWQIDSPIVGYIDGEITQQALNQLREKLKYYWVKSISEMVEVVKHCNQQPSLTAWGEPLFFSIATYSPTVLPGPRYGHRVEGKTIAETWVKILHRIKTTGTIRPTGYDGQWQELIDLVAVVNDEPEDFYFPEPNYLPIDRNFLENYIPQILDDAVSGEGVKYTYGQRLRKHFGKDQVEQVIHKLIHEIDAASAVMNLWDVADHERGGSPCLNHVWVRVVEGELSLTATLRSNDMFAAWPANAMGLRALQRHILDNINGKTNYNLTIGPLITISQSAHIYDDTWESVNKLIAEQYFKIIHSRDFYDSWGNFLIEVQEGEIQISQTTPGSGEVVACYYGRNPLKLVREIAAASPGINPEHIGYLGIELQKAQDCIKKGLSYVQDSGS